MRPYAVVWSPPESAERVRQREAEARRIVDQVFARVYQRRAEEGRFDDSAVLEQLAERGSTCSRS